MPKVTIDGKEFEAQQGQTVIQVALENGIDVPHFCWHPALTVAGNCRMCLVEIEKMPKLAIACATVITEGMVVKTLSEQAVKGREDVMEFLLINHPLDCPICDEAGQCKLQDYAFSHSRAESRFDEEKTHKDKRVPFGPNVLFDGERCISCSRCIRFASEIAEQPVLNFVDRGDHVTIAATPDEGFDSNVSMNVIDICPVGALTSRDFRFKARVWDMSFTDSVCPGCSRGCNIRVGVRNNEVLRLEPRPNMNVNDYWMCDYGRLNTYPQTNEDRMIGAHVRIGGTLKATDWDSAARAAAEGLSRFKQDQVLIIGSAFAPVEDNYLLQKLAKAKFGKKSVSYIPHVVGADERLLLKADKTPNANGAKILGLTDNALDLLRSGQIKAVYSLEDNLLAIPEVAAAFEGVEFFVCHATNDSATARRADVIFAASQWTEREGVLVNFQGWVQKLRPAVTTQYLVRGRDHMSMSRLDRFGTPYDKWARANKRDVRESWRITQLVAASLGQNWDYTYTEDLFEEAAQHFEEFRGMDYAQLGEMGLPLRTLKEQPKPTIYQEVYQDLTDRVESVASLIQ